MCVFHCNGWLIKLRRNDLYCLLVRRTRLCAAKSLLALRIAAQRMKNSGSSAAIRNHCCGSKRVPKPNLKQGLKRTVGGESVGRLSWSLSWWFWTPPPSLPKTHTWTNPSNTYTHLQLAHPVLPVHSAFWSWIWKSPQYTQTCVSCQLCSIRGSICGGRNEKSGEGWRERGGGLKGGEKSVEAL